MNKKAYSIGNKQFDEWLTRYFDTWYMTDRQYSQILDELAYRALECDNWCIPSLEFGYFVIVETYDEETADIYWNEYCTEYPEGYNTVVTEYGGGYDTQAQALAEAVRAKVYKTA